MLVSKRRVMPAQAVWDEEEERQGWRITEEN
jgi:hypothetical protein